MAACLLTKNPEVKEQLDKYTNILGSYSAAYYVLSQNNGFGLEYTPEGQDSKLFSDLLTHFHGDEAAAIREKSKIFSDQFKNSFQINAKFRTLNDNDSIDYLFAINDELNKIGSKEEYAEYLNSIFPTSVVESVYWHGTDSDFSQGFDSAVKGKGSGAPETGNEMYFNRQPWASLQYITGVNRTIPDEDGYNNWVKLWWELKEILGNGIARLDEWKNKIIGNDIRQEIPNKKGVFNRNDGGSNGSYLYERKARYGYENRSDKEFFEEVFGINLGKDTFNDWVQKNKIRFQEIWKSKQVKKGIYPAVLNVQNPIVEENQNTYYEEQRGLFTRAKEQGNDAIISNNAQNEFNSDVIVIFNPRQNVHILGSKQDLQQFKQWKDKNINAENYIEPTIDSVLNFGNVYHQTKQNTSFIPRDFLTDRQFKQLARNLAKLFPEIKVLWHQDLPEGEFGRIDTRDLEAITIMLSDNYQADTLPHEYAHRYIEMFRDTPIVQKAIEKFGSEEALVQAIGEQATKQVGEAYGFWKKLWEYIKALLSKQPTMKKALQIDLTNAFLQRKNLGKKSDIINSVIRQGQIYFQKKDKVTDIQQARQILQEMANQIEFDDNLHKYTHNGQVLKAVSTFKEELLYSVYDDSDITENQRNYNDNARVIGTTIHAALEDMFRGVYRPERFSKPIYNTTTGSLKQSALSRQTLKNLETIYNTISKNYDLVASEAMLADFDKGVAGTTDLILKNKKTGKFAIFDYKTKCIELDGSKENKDGKKLWGFSYVNRSKSGAKTSVNAYDFQLSAYEYMLKKAGIEIEERGIIPIVYYYNSKTNTVTNAMFTKKMGTNDINPEQGVYNIIKQAAVEYDVLHRVFGEEDEKYDNDYIQRRAKDFQDILNKITKSLSNKAMIDKRSGRRSQARQLEYIVDQIGNVSEVQAMVSYLKAATDQLSRVYNQISKRYKKEGLKDNKEAVVWDLKSLREYNDLALAYNVVDDISGFIQRYSSFLTNEELESIDLGIKEVTQLQKNIRNAYKEVGVRIYMQAISPYINNKRAEYRAKYEAEYRSKVDRVDTIEMNKYVEQQMQENADEIEEETQKFINRQMDVADSIFECSMIGANIGTVFQSRDPFVQASIIHFDNIMQQVDHEHIRWQRKLLKLTNEFEDKYGVGNWSNHRQAYDDLVEIIDGQAYLVSSVPNSYRVAYTKMLNELNSDNTLTFSQRQEKIQQWFDENAPIQDKKSLENDFIDRLKVALASLKKGTLDEIIKNVTDKDSKSWYYFYKQNKITLEQLDTINDIYKDLLDQYRMIDFNKYPNKKYENLLKLKESNDVKYRMWEFLQETITDGDKGVNLRQRLDNRLPSIRKTYVERVAEEKLKGIKDSVINFGKESVQLVEDDAIQGQTFTDMNGNVVKQIPLFYNGRLSLADQSFDLPTIFARWYKSALEHNAKVQMEDYLLMTAEILKDRTVESKSISILSKLKGKEEKARVHGENTYKQYMAWLDQVFYGNQITTTSDTTGKISVDKVMQTFMKYYSLRVMGGNYISMINNATVGMVNQLIEAAGGEVIDFRSYRKAMMLYNKHVVNGSLFADLGRRAPKDFINQLVEWFGVLEQGSPNYRAKGVQRLFTTDAAYWTTNVGEHVNQAEFLLAALYKLKAVDENGAELGDMIDFLSFDEYGQLVVDDKVFNFDINRQHEFSRGVRSTLMSMHGNYASRYLVALQQYMWGKLILMFRKWIYTGFKRRFQGRYYDNIRGKWVEGYHTTTWRVNKMLFFNRGYNALMTAMHKQIDQNKKDVLRWKDLSEDEKRNLYRSISEIGFIIAAYTLSLVFRGIADDEDDDEYTGLYMNIAYQMYRMYNDLSFNFNPFAMARILQNPVPAMSAIDNISKLMERIVHPTEVYSTGDRAGQNKLLYSIGELIPLYRQMDRFSQIQEEFDFLKSKG